MLSVLIPTYNYDVTVLVNSLHEQLNVSNINFEIIIFDDGSNAVINVKNDRLNTLKFVTFKANKKNVGLSNNRNLLIKHSKYDYVLLLDADMLVTSKTFISKYLQHIKNLKQVVYGGIKYSKNKPEKLYALRWNYGIESESKTAEERKKNKYLSLLCSNILIKKTVFEKVTFNTNLNTYGYEDTLFCFHLKHHAIKVHHIENSAIHNDKTTTTEFISKTKSALANLKYITEGKLIDSNFITLSKVYNRIKVFKLHSVLSFVYRIFSNTMENRLNSSNPSLSLFNLYKLSYFCFIKLRH